MNLTDIKSNMQFVDTLWHLVNFVLPALVMAPAMVLTARFVYRKPLLAQSLFIQFAINFAVCVAVLIVGLAWAGHDGRLLTYAALVLASASTQAVLAASRAGRFNQG